MSAGLGMAMLPRSVVERSAHRKELKIHKLARDDAYIETVFINHKTRVCSTALERLIEVIVARRRRNGEA